MRKVYFIAIFIVVFGFHAFGQEDSLQRQATVKQEVSGYWRTFFMATDNQLGLKDWSALATGGMLKYTASYKGIVNLGVGYYTSINLNISDIDAVDGVTGKKSRYERALFDVANAGRQEVNLLGELYLQLKLKQHSLTLGRMKLNTPFVNPQDGRMIPTLEQGVWYAFTPSDQLSVHSGWITHFAPRSTGRFYTVEESLGLSSSGRNLDGSAAQYAGELATPGLGILAVEYNSAKWGVELWDYYLPKIYNSFYGQAFYRLPIKESELKVGLQYLGQSRLGNGGSDDPSKQYFHNQQSHTLGMQLKLSMANQLQLSLNANHITAEGRFVFPREWGRESLFTYQRRERLEGMGNATAWTLVMTKKWELESDAAFSAMLGYGQAYRPAVEDYAHAKYGFPSNDQLNIDLYYYFGGKMKGLVAELLVVGKRAIGDNNEDERFIINKTGMVNYNLVVNYHF